MFIRYEKLQRWDDALEAYTAKATQALSPHLVIEATLGINFSMMAHLIIGSVLSLILALHALHFYIFHKKKKGIL